MATDSTEPTAEAMRSDILMWLGPRGTNQNARQWLVALIQHYGEATVAEGYSMLKADLAAGAVIAQPMQTWCTIMTRLLKEAGKMSPAKNALSYENLPRMVAEVSARRARQRQ